MTKPHGAQPRSSNLRLPVVAAVMAAAVIVAVIVAGTAMQKSRRAMRKVPSSLASANRPVRPVIWVAV